MFDMLTMFTRKRSQFEHSGDIRGAQLQRSHYALLTEAGTRPYETATDTMESR